MTHPFQKDKRFLFKITDISGEISARVDAVSDRFIALIYIEHYPERGFEKQDFDGAGKGNIRLWVNVDNIKTAIGEL